MKNKLMIIGILLLVFSFIGCPETGGTYNPGNGGDTVIPEDYVVVTFQTNGGTAIERQIIPGGSKISPAVTTRTGRHLEGWYTDVDFDAKWNFDTDTVVTDLTLYARWIQNPPGTFTVSFNTNKGTWVADQAVTTGGKLTAVSTTREGGFTFDNWYSGSMYNTVVNFDTYTVTGAVTLTARWNEPTLLPDDEPFVEHPKGKYGNYYQIFPYSWATSDTRPAHGTYPEGVRWGDFKGMLARIDHINDTGTPQHNAQIAQYGECNLSLHLDGLWLCPINPSPSFHKYDSDDFMAIHPRLGTMDDFDAFLEACNDRGIRVILDLMLNHTGPNHEWFVSARSDILSPYRTYYNFLTTPTGPNSLWRPNTFPGSTGGLYEGVFSTDMPDLNFDEEKVMREFENIAKFWLDKGIAGYRLDAVKHIFETHHAQGATPNHTKNRVLMRWFNEYCVGIRPDAYLVGEVWSAQSEVLLYTAGPAGSGGGLISNFNFDMQYAIATGIQNANSNNLSTRVVNNYNAIKNVNKQGIDSVFLGNHDGERFATRVGATNQTRLRMGALISLFIPGNNFVYYGDELGMPNGVGSGGDDRARTRMPWVSDQLGPNMCTGRITNGAVTPVDAQMADPNSLLRFYIRAINLKNRYPQIHWGQPTVITVPGNQVSAIRINSRGEMRNLAVVHNHGSTSQTVNIPGAKFLGGHLVASGTTEPTLNGTSLVIPGFSLAIIEF